MGGLGSGRTRDFNSKTTIDDVNRISIYDLRKQGMLEAGASGTLSWSLGQRETGSVALYVPSADQLILQYQYLNTDGSWEPIEEVVQLTWTPCHLGGKRPWFKCPQCSRRVAVLCGHGKRFFCRSCYDLPYASQQRGIVKLLTILPSP